MCRFYRALVFINNMLFGSKGRVRVCLGRLLGVGPSADFGFGLPAVVCMMLSLLLALSLLTDYVGSHLPETDGDQYMGMIQGRKERPPLKGNVTETRSSYHGINQLSADGSLIGQGLPEDGANWGHRHPPPF